MFFLFFLLYNAIWSIDSYSWSIDRINQKHIIPDFHNFYTDFGQNVTVYVIDSGFTNNTNFHDNIILTKSFIDNDVNDVLGHGTHVISLISSKYGVSDNVQIVSLKIFNNDNGNSSGSDSHLMDALVFSGEHCLNHYNKCIINLSLGFDNIVENIDNKLNQLYDQGFIIIVSAGNSNTNSCLRSPSHLDNVITVGSIDYFDFKSSFSNFGNCTNLYTYGEFIPGLNLNNSFILKSGTSMSAPIVSGFIANLWSKNKDLNNIQLMNKFYDNYLLTKNNLNILYTSENQYEILLIFIPIFISYLFFKILFFICCCQC